MADLARRVNYSRSYLSKIENNVKPPNDTLARLCDEVLGTGGALLGAARSARSTKRVDRRAATGASAVLDTALAGGPHPVPDERVIAGLRASFEDLRRLGRQTSPAVVLAALVGQVRAVRRLAADTPEPVRSRLQLLAARFAEYAGWPNQELGDDPAAVRWTRLAATWGLACGDQEIANYALVRAAGVALYRQDAASTVDLARRARGSERTRGLAARREAQGHALAGDRTRFERAMDHAAVLFSSSTVDFRVPVLGPTAADPIALARGWSLADLGRPAAAAALLDDAVTRLPVANRRSRARFGTRRALAHAWSGEIEEACRTLAEVIEDAAQVDSATVRLDLRELARVLSRSRGNHAVAEIYPSLRKLLFN